jgi:hypothetical protein
MYSGTTLTRFSGRVIGAHQKIDRSARKQLDILIKNQDVFPSIAEILEFEGKNGPDAIKRKSPARDEPWHYYSPFNDKDSILIELINEHYKNLVKEIRHKNEERVSFEAAWLAHAIVDGLTPAHHYPYEKKLLEISGGKSIEERTSIAKKNIPKGENTRETIKNTWKMWGPKGLISTHGLFELGVAVLMAPLSDDSAALSPSEIDNLKSIGITEVFRNTAREIAVLDIYNDYYKKGWTPRSAYVIRQNLYPAIVKTVTMAWYSAILDANVIKPTKNIK